MLNIAPILTIVLLPIFIYFDATKHKIGKIPGKSYLLVVLCSLTAYTAVSAQSEPETLDTPMLDEEACNYFHSDIIPMFVEYKSDGLSKEQTHQNIQIVTDTYESAGFLNEATSLGNILNNIVNILYENQPLFEQMYQTPVFYVACMGNKINE